MFGLEDGLVMVPTLSSSCIQEEEAWQATMLGVVIRAWASHCKMIHNRYLQVVHNLKAADFSRDLCLRRALRAWTVAVKCAQREAHTNACRSLAFQLWQVRAKDKKACCGSVSARAKVKARGWANEVQPRKLLQNPLLVLVSSCSPWFIVQPCQSWSIMSLSAFELYFVAVYITF